MENAKKSFLKNLVGFSMVTWISFAVGFISSPIATRLFLPEELGKINLFNTYATLLGSVCYLGLDQAFVRYFREPPAGSTRRGMLTYCLVTSLGFGLVSSLLLGFGWQSLSVQVMGEADVSVYVCLCVFGMSMVLYRYLSLCYRMEQNAKLYTIQGVVYIVLTKLAYLSVGFGSARAKPAIVLLTALATGFALVCLWLQRKRLDAGFGKQADKPFRKSLWAYALPLAPITLVSWLNSSISQVALRNLMDFHAIGIYTSALALASTVNVLQSGFNTYWTPYVYENYQSDNKRRFMTVHRLMACLLTLFGLGVTLLQTPVFLLLGKNYREAAVFFPLLFLSPICYCLSETTGMGIGIAKKTHWNTITFVLSALVNLGLCFWLIPMMGAAGAALASALAAVVSLGVRTAAGERYYKAITDYRYLFYAVGLMTVASVGNLLLATQPVAKYLLLAVTLGLACFLFRREIKTLWDTALELLKGGRGALQRRMKSQGQGEEKK